jgi:hypothetical protein
MNIEKLLEALMETEVQIDWTTLKWGSEYTGGVKKTTHARVTVGTEVVSYDYRSVRELLEVLSLIPHVKIRLNGELIDEIRFSTTKNS